MTKTPLAPAAVRGAFRHAVLALLAAAAVPASVAFGRDGGGAGRRIGRRLVPTDGRSLSAAAAGDSAASAMSDYMARSHEEKLRAIKAVEDKKNSEIEVRGGGRRSAVM
jgi:hypothetical protein